MDKVSSKSFNGSVREKSKSDSACTHLIFFASTPFNAHCNKEILHYLYKPKFEMLPNEIIPFVIN